MERDPTPSAANQSLAPGNDRGLDFTAHARRLCEDLSVRLSELAHIDMSRVALRICQVRRGGLHGVQATLTPLRFAGGELEMTRRGRRWTIDRLYDAEGREMLYLLSFYVPRFLEHTLEEKLATVCHELWHIGTEFDGDLRRHAGRCYAHGPSEREYHAAMIELARRWLALNPPAELHAFLNGNFRQLVARYGRVYGTRIPTPRLIPLPRGAA
ncbi:MAG TPA: hypothetical protein VHV55_23730 [Pirellulales bacterium]|jgi:hypothetical protein|nr:hypothetical protein [Pirellulales bacterium]